MVKAVGSIDTAFVDVHELAWVLAWALSMALLKPFGAPCDVVAVAVAAAEHVECLEAAADDDQAGLFVAAAGQQAFVRWKGASRSSVGEDYHAPELDDPDDTAAAAAAAAEEQAVTRAVLELWKLVLDEASGLRC
jgi:hypothetical protein